MLSFDEKEEVFFDTADYLLSEELWNWFQNRRYALRAKAAKNPGKLNVSPLLRDDSAIAKSQKVCLESLNQYQLL